MTRQKLISKNRFPKIVLEISFNATFALSVAFSPGPATPSLRSSYWPAHRNTRLGSLLGTATDPPAPRQRPASGPARFGYACGFVVAQNVRFWVLDPVRSRLHTRRGPHSQLAQHAHTQTNARKRRVHTAWQTACVHACARARMRMCARAHTTRACTHALTHTPAGGHA